MRFLKKEFLWGVKAYEFFLFRGGRELIRRANFVISPGRKVALIGRNGGGKTTFLETVVSIARKEELPFGTEIEGQLEVFPGTKVGYLPQEIKINFSGTVEEYLDLCAEEVAQTYLAYEEIQKKLEGETSLKLLEEFGRLIERMNFLDAWDYPQKRKLLLEGLGLTGEYLKRKVLEISGGEAARVALAGVLISFPNLVLLDEPTNNLDFPALKFLEEWIKKGKFSLLVVSHDRRFLDRVIDEVLEIDEWEKTVNSFGGNYSFYAEQKRIMFEAQQRAYEEEKRRREQLEEAAKELKRKAQRFEGLSRNAFYRAKGASLAKQAKVQLKRIERELMSIPEPQPPKKPAFVVLEKEPPGNLINVNNLYFFYSGGEEIFHGFSFKLKGNERVAIIGENGAGKTTFLRLLLGEIKPQKGQIYITAKVAYLPQNPGEVDASFRVLDFFRSLVKTTEEEAQKILGRVLFRDVSKERIGNFSIGEIRRIQIAALFASAPELIILDEPTNHLDIFTIEMLEEALGKFKGGLLVVSHDEWFLRNINPERTVVFKKGQKPLVKNRLFD